MFMVSIKIDIVDGPLDAGMPQKPKYRTVRQADGRMTKLRMIDADSPSFAADFKASFKASVRMAREENRAHKSKI